MDGIYGILNFFFLYKRDSKLNKYFKYVIKPGFVLCIRV
jgi:hypothetical protein